MAKRDTKERRKRRIMTPIARFLPAGCMHDILIIRSDYTWKDAADSSVGDAVTNWVKKTLLRVRLDVQAQRYVPGARKSLKRPGINIKVLFCVLALVTACANSWAHDDRVNLPHAPTVQHIVQTYVYECHDGFSFIARIEGEKTWLFLPDQTLDLPLVPSGSGAKYSKVLITFWSKGEEALLETGKST
jgi:membrane-bound inhibitor of C-type lysozyme